jgi:hypothetical protein
METTWDPPEHEKLCVGILHPGRTRMHYMTSISHRTEKHKFGTMCPSTLFVESVPVPPEHEKQCIDTLASWLQQNALIVQSVTVPPEHET